MSTPADIRAVLEDIDKNVLTERTREIHTLGLGALAGVNINQLGPAGTGKSMMSRALCERIEGARLFSKTLHAQMPADAIIGGYDMPEFARSGEFKRNVEHYLPNAHVGFLDEWSRANGPTLDALLPMLNCGERLAEGNGGMFKTPLLFVVLASNFTPAPDDPQFGALVDRITLNQYIEPIRSQENFTNMLAARRSSRISAAAPVTITLSDFEDTQLHVKAMQPSADFSQAFVQLRAAARSAGLLISDRAWGELEDVCAASAWLNGRTEIMPTDIPAIEGGLWRDSEDRSQARELILPYQSKYVQVAAKLRAEAEKSLAQLDEKRPLVEGVPVGESTPSDLMGDVRDISRALGAVNGRIQASIKDAERDQERVPELLELSQTLQGAKSWLEANYMPAAW